MARGDHLFYRRAVSTYSHHGICCGDGTVIHYESSLWMKFVGNLTEHRVPTVRRVSYDAFAMGALVTTRRYQQSDSPEIVVNRALSRLGEADYDLLTNNCEHFAVWCKTGESHSTQVAAHRHASQAVIKGSPIGIYLFRASRRVPGPYRTWAYVGSAAVAGSVYLANYVAHRRRNGRQARS